MIYDFYDLPQSGQVFDAANLDIGHNQRSGSRLHGWIQSRTRSLTGSRISGNLIIPV